VLARVHRWATAAWLGLVGGAGLGFITRDLLHLAQAEVAFSWFTGAALGLVWASRGLRDRLWRPPIGQVVARPGSEGGEPREFVRFDDDLVQ
jgi:hypothetical protein